MSSSLNVLTRGKTPVWTVIILAWPTIMEQMLVSLTHYVDAAMVGALGATYTAAVGVCSSTLGLITGLLTSIAVGLSVQVAQSIGADDINQARKVVKQSLRILFCAVPILLVLACIISYVIPIIMGAEADVRPMATSYMFIIGCAWPFRMANLVFSNILRCMGEMRMPLVFNALANVLNVILNFLFIYPTREISVFGHSFVMWGAGMGVAGAALATALSMVFAGSCIFAMIMVRKNPLKVPLSGCRENDNQITKNMIKIGLPITLERLVLCSAHMMMTKIVTSLGTVALAANHLASTAEQICYLPGVGFGNAATTLIGQSVGAREKEMAVRFGNITIVLSMIVSFSMSLLLFIFAPQILLLFTRDAQVLQLGATILRIMAFSQGFLAVSSAIGGILRGAGETRWQFYINAACMWGVRIILAVILAYPCSMGLVGVWTAAAIDLAIRFIAFMYRFYCKKWTVVFDR